MIGLLLGALSSCLFSVLIAVGMMASSAVMHVLILRSEVTGTIGEAFNFSAVKENLAGMFKPFFVGNLVVGLCVTAMTLVLYFLPFVGLIIALFFATAAQSELRTEVYRDYLAAGGHAIGTVPQHSRL